MLKSCCLKVAILCILCYFPSKLARVSQKLKDMLGKLKECFFSRVFEIFVFSEFIQVLPNGFASYPLPEWHYMPKWLH